MSDITAKATAKLFVETPSAMVTRSITPNITTFSVPFARFGLANIGGRSTLAKLQSGSLAIFSPVDLSEDVRKTVDSMGGNVSYIIAPDIEHHLYIAKWKSAWPSAKILGPQGLEGKRRRQGNEDVSFDFTFTAKNKKEMELPSDFTSTFDVEYVDGHSNREIVLYHKTDKTLIQADLLFNLPSNEQYSKHNVDPSNIWTRIFQIFTQTSPGYEKSQQRFIWYAMAKDKPSFNESVKRISGWDIQRIIPCHGDVIEKDGNDIFRKMFAWHL